MPASWLRDLLRRPTGNGRTTDQPARVRQYAPPTIQTVPRIDIDTAIDPTAASAILASLLRLRAELVSQVPLQVIEEGTEGTQWLADHPVQRLLDLPHPDLATEDLLEVTCYALDMTGLAIWLWDDLDPRGRPRRLLPLSGAHVVRRQPGADGRVWATWDLRLATGVATVPADRLVFIRIPDPAQPWRERAPVRSVAHLLGCEQQLWEAVGSALRQAIAPSGVVRVPADIDMDLDQLMARLAREYEGARRHGRALVLTHGLDYQRLPLGWQGLAGGPLLRELEATIAAALGVRPEVVGLLVGLEHAPWSHMRTAWRLVYDTMVIPLWRRIERAVTQQLLWRLDPTPTRLVRVDTSRVSGLAPDREADARVVAMLARAGIATRNELRQLVGLDRRDDDPLWDEIPTGGAAAAAAATAGQDGDRAEGRTDRPPPAVRAAGPDRDALTWLATDTIAQSAQHQIGVVVRRLLAEDAAALAEELLRLPGQRAAQPDRRLLAEIVAILRRLWGPSGTRLAAWERALAEALMVPARQAGLAAAAGLGAAWGLVDPVAVAVARDRAAVAVRQIADTTRQKLRRAIAEGLRSGQSIEDLAAAIRKQDVGAFSASRAVLIARTEATTITNAAQLRLARQAEEQLGRRLRKRWLTARDARVRPEHVELEGETRPLDQPFSNGLLHPGEPNCRCTLVYEPVDEGTP